MKEYNGKHVLLNEGKLKAYKNGRVWRIPRESLREYIQKSAQMKISTTS
ncbi:MAG: helix-turn-helix domain-containing protein [Oscillospiraceae bacterium]|nr:helix-turn-helix domain-containing protein [Oscillospiraceae bacterium]